MTEDDLRAIRQHLDHLRRQGAPTTTRYGREGVLRRLAVAIDRPLLQATPADLDDWQCRLEVAPATLQVYTCHARAFFDWAEDRGLISLSPARKLPVPRVPRRVARPIPEEDLQIALACAVEPMRTWLLLAAFLGLRACEIGPLRGSDLMVVEDRLYVTGRAKGGDPFRLPLPPELRPVMEAHAARAGQGPLWRGRYGAVVTARVVSQTTVQFFRRLGMSYTIHQLRHRFGTSIYHATRDLLLTQELMRHQSPTTTQCYVLTSSVEATAARDQLAAALRPRRTTRRRPPAQPPSTGLAA